MKLAPYVERLNNSSQYHDFAKQYADAFIVAGFFVLDFEAGKNMHQIDYYVPSQKKIAAFTLDGGVSVQLLGVINKKIPEKLDLKTNIDLEALKGILEDEMKNRSITEQIQKIIAVLQTVDGKKIWNLNCVLSGMGILRASVEDDSQSVLKMEKSSIMDYIKKIPGSQLANLQAQMQGKSTNEPPARVSAANESPSPESISDELKKLDKIESAIKVEKAELQKQFAASEKKKTKSVAPSSSTPVKGKKK